ncbi:helix-turn-helix domain-containing protein [Paraburkholderia sp. J67]|uniref:helix-turn-helix domain-containing protein n=1 Tax=Paraburkholderia sp. J67 TaxID=2805435 RepID=UPI002ABE1325|nr:helix-turn-helix domain-containing protein [Paraburkholderia sp. J67]
MPNEGKIATPSVADALALAHERMEELFKGLGASLPAEVQREVTNGVEAILVEVLSRYTDWQRVAGEFMSIAEAATLLFVSRPHVMKLVERGQLKLHHKTGNNCFLTKTSVLEYHAARQDAAKAYNASSLHEE